MAYNPGIAYNGNQALFAGASQGAGRLADFFMKMGDDAGKAKSLRQVVKAYNPDIPTDHLGLRDLEGMVQGHALQQAEAERKRTADQQGRQLDVSEGHLKLAQDDATYRQDPRSPSNLYQGSLTRALNDRETEQAGTRSRLSDFNRGLSDQATRLSEIGLTPTGSDVMRIAAQTGSLGMPEVDRVLATQTRWGGAADGAADPSLAGSFEEDPISGQRFYHVGKQVLPSGSSRTGMNSDGSWSAQPVVDSQGNVIGNAVRNGKGGPQLLPANKPMTVADRVKLHEQINLLEMRAKGEKDPEHLKQIQSDVQELRGLLMPSGKTGKSESADGAADNPLAQAAQIRADFKSGKLKRDAAEAALKKLGIFK